MCYVSITGDTTYYTMLQCHSFLLNGFISVSNTDLYPPQLTYNQQQEHFYIIVTSLFCTGMLMTCDKFL